MVRPRARPSWGTRSLFSVTSFIAKTKGNDPSRRLFLWTRQIPSPIPSPAIRDPRVEGSSSYGDEFHDTSMSLHKLTLHELHERFTKGDVTAREIMRAFGLRINQVEPKIKAYVTLTQASAMAQADALDEQLKGWRK